MAAGTIAQDYVQLLIAPRIEQLLHGAASQGLPTGSRTRDGQMRYLNAFWQMCYDVLQVYRLYLPQMIGRGGNKVALYPGGIAPVRIARSAPARVGAQNETTAPVTAATRLVPFCR